MEKVILLERLARPDEWGVGRTYLDKITVIADDTRLLHHGTCRTSPNAIRPSDEMGWTVAYHLLAAGEYRWAWYDSPKRGPCLLLENGRPLPSVNALVGDAAGSPTMTWVEIHAGQTADWAGSAGCITLPPADWPAFIGCFAPGETGAVKLVEKVRL